MARVAGFEELEVFLAKTSRGVLVKTKEDMGTTLLEIAKAVVPATPVDTGLARGNWQSTVGAAASAPTDRLDKTGAAAIAQARAAARSASVGTSLHLVNRVPYINKLDAGHSAQAPPGFIKAAILLGFARAAAINRRRRLQLLNKVL